MCTLKMCESLMESLTPHQISNNLFNNQAVITKINGAHLDLFTFQFSRQNYGGRTQVPNLYF